MGPVQFNGPHLKATEFLYLLEKKYWYLLPLTASNATRGSQQTAYN